MLTPRYIFSTLVILASLTGVASARDHDLELSLTGGSTRVSLDAGDAFDGEWGVNFAPSFSLSPLTNTPQFRVGAGLGVSWISADVDNDFVSGRADLFLITPELLLSWRQRIADHVYLEPGVGVGAVIGGVDFIGVEWGSGYSFRPFLRFGYQAERWSAGIEASYRFGQLNFHDADDGIENLNVGVFLGLKV